MPESTLSPAPTEAPAKDPSLASAGLEDRPPSPRNPPPADKHEKPIVPARPKGIFEDIFVAIHGIGAQQRNATVRAVANRFATSEAIGETRFSPQPLGYFHGGHNSTIQVSPLDGSEKGKPYGFAEVFWAYVPQHATEDEATLEEIKAWGRTVAARAQSVFARAERELEQLWQQANQAGLHANDPAKKDLQERSKLLIPPDFSLAAEVIDEIVDTIQVLENLSYLAEKAGLIKFDLREVLNEFVGDVQVVAEFKFYREHILGRFHDALKSIHKQQSDLRKTHPAFEGIPLRIHLVAHSEGTVVAFFGLLHALCGEVWETDGKLENDAKPATGPDPAPWLDGIYGLMTLGSPIDKHLLLWRELTDSLQATLPQRPPGRRRIEWRNYYDYGDPVGFELDSARHYLWKAGDTHFNFCDCRKCQHDIGFARYMLPGKAHNDYWGDPAVFDHYIRSVVQGLAVDPLHIPNGEKWWRAAGELCLGLAKRAGTKLRGFLPGTARNPASANTATSYAQPPITRPEVYILSPLVPYLCSALLIAIGTFVLYKAVAQFVHPEYQLLQRYVAFTIGGEEPATKAAAGVILLQSSLAVAALIWGTTVAARLPRLALGMQWRAALFWLLGAGAYIWGLPSGPQQAIGTAFVGLAHKSSAGTICQWLWPAAPEVAAATLGVLSASLGVIAIGYLATIPPIGSRKTRRHGSGVIQEAVPLRQVAQRQQRWWRKGARPLILVGAVTILILVVYQVRHFQKNATAIGRTKTSALALGTTETPAKHPSLAAPLNGAFLRYHERAIRREQESVEALLRPTAPVWPVLLAGAAFLYLWWLSTLIFDLAFVWHRYIRRGAALQRLRGWRSIGRGVDLNPRPECTGSANTPPPAHPPAKT